MIGYRYRRCDEIGIHASLKMMWEQSRVGSSPTSGIIYYMKRTIDIKTFAIVTVLLATLSMVQWFWVDRPTNTAEDKKIKAISLFVSQISDSYIRDVRELVQKTKVPSWGCGPSSYALAQIINTKFFNNQLNIDALYDNDPYEITERFGFIRFDQNGQKIIGDHAWVEIYIKDKLLFIDPTVSQYGKTSGIAFEIFNIGDPTIKTYLEQKYNIIDYRISILLRKVEQHIPIDQEPYPGYSINPQDVGYYREAVNIRNTVSLGREPVAWKDWVNYLSSRYYNK